MAYAAERYITVIPEIDLPGHMQAALAAYPELGCTGGPYEVWRMWGISDNVLCAGNDKTIRFIKDVLAVIIGMIHLLVPYMVLSLVGVLQSIDPNVEYAAYSLGASPLQTFSKVVFPLSLPGIISGCVLVFTMSMTSYVTPKLLGGSKFRMMATMVVQEINVNFDWGAASAISYILLAVILLVQIAVVLCTSGYMKRMGGGK